ncbi:MAG: lipoyl synthase, partial [Candidatus Latescibacterota bacterium]
RNMETSGKGLSVDPCARVRQFGSMDQEEQEMKRKPARKPKPPWLKMRIPCGEAYLRVKGLLRKGQLHPVCQEARCPNLGECWGEGTATFLILGKTCTRGCRFCAVETGRPGGGWDREEPLRIAEAAAAMKLRFVVLTSVDRDDLPDGGAEAFALTLHALRRAIPGVRTEVLTPDFQGSRASLETVLLQGRPEVFAHNVETVRSLTPKVRDRRCSFDTSLQVLRLAKEILPGQVTKSGLMLGMGEKKVEVLEAMEELRSAGVKILTLGQYLQPTPRHLPVDRFVEPGEFLEFAREGKRMGFAHVASAPLVRSSYQAALAFEKASNDDPDKNP